MKAPPLLKKILEKYGFIRYTFDHDYFVKDIPNNNNYVNL